MIFSRLLLHQEYVSSAISVHYAPRMSCPLGGRTENRKCFVFYRRIGSAKDVLNTWITSTIILHRSWEWFQDQVNIFSGCLKETSRPFKLTRFHKHSCQLQWNNCFRWHILTLVRIFHRTTNVARCSIKSNFDLFKYSYFVFLINTKPFTQELQYFDIFCYLNGHIIKKALKHLLNTH